MIPRVSVIVPCRNEAQHLEACLDSIVASEYPSDRLEVMVVDGRSEDASREIAERYARRHAWIRVLDNPRRVVPVALNLGIQQATGDVIIRLDAHGVYPPDYVPRLVTALLETGADNVGGQLVTLPGGAGAVPRAIAIALSHPFGVGNSYFRIGVAEPRWTDTVPFGCFRRDVFTRFGLFDEELVRNQDDELNHRILHRGGRVLLLPSVVARYYGRRSLGQLGRMYYQYGEFKPLVARKVGRVMTLRQLAPPALVLALAGLPALALFLPAAGWLWAAFGSVYGAALVSGALPSALRFGPRCGLALVAAFAVLHVSYGMGFLRGLARLARPAGRPPDPATVPLSR
jgi:glycosyltransferase involved in cell wall biosynthesis